MLLRWLVTGYLRLLDYPRVVLLGIALVAIVAAYHTTHFSFDASSETLVVEGDPDLAAYVRVAETFAGDDFLLLTFTPHEGSALDRGNLAVIEDLAADIESITGVAGTFSVLDAPLLKSPPVALDELASGFRTLRHLDVDVEMARAELAASPLFSELLITLDGRTTALRIDLQPDHELQAVERELLRLRSGDVPVADRTLADVEADYDSLRAGFLERRNHLIQDVRSVRDRYRQFGVLYLGGVPMIAADMIAFVKSDLVVFGVSVAGLIMVALFGFFRSVRWVLIPLGASALTILFTTGVLGFIGRPATVVSSNFIALLAIINISLSIHLIVRYRELVHLQPEASVTALVRQTMVSKFAPCLYNALTTMAAFGSLMASSIVPVEDFGWMMCLGIAIGLCMMFLFFPAVLLQLPAPRQKVVLNEELGLTRVMSQGARWRPVTIVCAAGVLAVVAIIGVSKVSMDNRFLDYFQEDTDINQGMRFIDANLGGTVPFDVVLNFGPFEAPELEEDDFFFDESEQAESFPARYWFTRDKLDKVAVVHRYMDERPEIGKVMSVVSLEDLAEEFTDGEKLSNVQIAGVLGALPEDARRELLEPYASPQTGQMRINARVIESGLRFDRAALVADIRDHATNEAGIRPEAVTITGMMVLFDSMLKQLFSSQIDTLMYVLLATLIMFLVLLRSFLYAVVGLLPNCLAATMVVSFMGYAGIPLDMMTITIAAVSIGIGVDDAIHYLHRFKEEYERDADARLAVAWSHATIGRAMYFTSLTIAIGFSVLGFSNFVPTILFGLLVAVAMMLAMIANLTLLPSLLVLVLGKRRTAPPVVANG